MNMKVTIQDDGTVLISKEYFDELVDDSLFLTCLRNGGVDNWAYWDEAVEEYHSLQE